MMVTWEISMHLAGGGQCHLKLNVYEKYASSQRSPQMKFLLVKLRELVVSHNVMAQFKVVQCEKCGSPSRFPLMRLMFVS
eukprot:c14117_g1_i1 orf=271-510(+)